MPQTTSCINLIIRIPDNMASCTNLTIRIPDNATKAINNFLYSPHNQDPRQCGASSPSTWTCRLPRTFSSFPPPVTKQTLVSQPLGSDPLLCECPVFSTMCAIVSSFVRDTKAQRCKNKHETGMNLSRNGTCTVLHAARAQTEAK